MPMWPPGSHPRPPPPPLGGSPPSCPLPPHRPPPSHVPPSGGARLNRLCWRWEARAGVQDRRGGAPRPRRPTGARGASGARTVASSGAAGGTRGDPPVGPRHRIQLCIRDARRGGCRGHGSGLCGPCSGTDKPGGRLGGCNRSTAHPHGQGRVVLHPRPCCLGGLPARPVYLRRLDWGAPPRQGPHVRRRVELPAKDQRFTRAPAQCTPPDPWSGPTRSHVASPQALSRGSCTSSYPAAAMWATHPRS